MASKFCSKTHPSFWFLVFYRQLLFSIASPCLRPEASGFQSRLRSGGTISRPPRGSEIFHPRGIFFPAPISPPVFCSDIGSSVRLRKSVPPTAAPHVRAIAIAPISAIQPLQSRSLSRSMNDGSAPAPGPSPGALAQAARAAGQAASKSGQTRGKVPPAIKTKASPLAGSPKTPTTAQTSPPASARSRKRLSAGRIKLEAPLSSPESVDGFDDKDEGRIGVKRACNECRQQK
jgi:hypothetical protein